MPKLNTLICDYMFVNYLKKELPHLHIDTDLDSTRFANPNAIFGRKVGIWEIECNRLDICKCVVFEFRIRIKQRTKENNQRSSILLFNDSSILSSEQFPAPIFGMPFTGSR